MTSPSPIRGQEDRSALNFLKPFTGLGRWGTLPPESFQGSFSLARKKEGMEPPVLAAGRTTFTHSHTHSFNIHFLSTCYMLKYSSEQKRKRMLCLLGTKADYMPSSEDREVRMRVSSCLLGLS